jgi:hypothetical protein
MIRFPGLISRSPAHRRFPQVLDTPVHRTHLRRPLLLLALLAACGGSENAIAPQYEPQVVNLQNDFAFQVTALDRVSDNIQYTWRNDGTAATVNQSPSNLSGTVSLVILDANGTQVYARSLTDNGTFTTTSGGAGNWTVRVAFSQASGAVNFRLQKP